MQLNKYLPYVMNSAWVCIESDIPKPIAWRNEAN
jgi:hypothetical protein